MAEVLFALGMFLLGFALGARSRWNGGSCSYCGYDKKEDRLP